ncbi:class I SAM-dependent methyltransferase [Thalassotalea piscium]|uniref:DUF4942 domain-containing protein n=1 Tax=Thalassotalea piscium TaxID=1230533 RepID=A0A7X0NK54_9GAMM|nr:DUF4942 domain-containing protein [Thalassotalea piscium]MBB6544791.1 hypothetical protein [Thalassotalea piscium]
MKQSTLSLVQDLKDSGNDFEWYPTTDKQINTIIDDIKIIKKDFDFTTRYSEAVKVLDVGAGDGRVLEAITAAFKAEEYFNIDAYAIEKVDLHTNTYRKKGITLLGTEFNQVNFISKNCDIGFVNPPYSEFSHWIQTLISHLRFGILYAVIPERWKDDPAIKEAMALRGVKFSKVLSTSDFLDADRTARAKVNIVRFSFNELIADEDHDHTHRRYKHNVSYNSTDPFDLFLENELNLKKTYSETNEKFNEYCEKERVRKEMATEGTPCFELVTSKGVLWALLDNYERDLANTLEQYKLISTINPSLLQELGVDFDALLKGAKEKMLGYRNVYWHLLFEKLDAISTRLTQKHKNDLLNTLSANALDFTYTNALYIIQYAVEVGNELIEQSLIDVYINLTSPDAISRYYKSNKHIYSDDWRYTNTGNEKAKYVLDYRFIHSNHSNFSGYSWDRGLNEGARAFTSDLVVAFKLLGYTNLYTTCSYDQISYGGKISIIGTTPSGEVEELVDIKYYKNGNRHLKFNQEAMLRLNVTVSRLLGWVRSKDEFVEESQCTETVNDNVWAISDDMKVTPSNILMLTCKAA